MFSLSGSREGRRVEENVYVGSTLGETCHRGSSGALPFRPRQTPVKEEILDSGKGDPGYIWMGRVDEDVVLVLYHCRGHAEQQAAAGARPGSPQVRKLGRRRKASPVWRQGGHLHHFGGRFVRDLDGCDFQVGRREGEREVDEEFHGGERPGLR